jgi:hypothetical protein
VNCEEARLAIGAEPGRRSAELAAHLAACSACAAFAAEMAAFDARIRHALEVPVPPVTRSVPAAASARRGAAGAVARLLGGPSRRSIALAAGGLIAAVIAAALWTGYPRESLAGALVGHMSHEPDSWTHSAPVSPDALAYVLGRSHVRLEAGAPLVSYANSCWFRGWFVPHLVVQTERGPVTVIVLTHERVRAKVAIDSDGYRGVIVPAARGALAVLAREVAGGAAGGGASSAAGGAVGGGASGAAGSGAGGVVGSGASGEADVDAVAARVAAVVRYLD